MFNRMVSFFIGLSLVKKTLMSTIALLLLGVLSLFGLYLSVSLGIVCEMPDDQDLLNIKNYKASEVYASDGQVIGRYFVENRTETNYEDISPFIVDALVATEDVRFWEHKGIDQRSLMRVLFKSIILRQKNAGGGSTLSQQLIKNVFGRESYGVLTMPIIKIKESILANKLNHLYTKEEIITLYLNTVSFGEDTYGITTACERFFSTNAKDITLEQAAVLVGMLKAPTSYNPRLHPERSLKRRNTVLHQMLKYKKVTKVKYDEVVASPLTLEYNRSTQNEGVAAYFKADLKKHVQTIVKEYNEEFGTSYNLETDGLKIYTTLDFQLQTAAEKAVVGHLSNLSSKLFRECRSQKVIPKAILEDVKNSHRYQELKSKGMDEDAILDKLRLLESSKAVSYQGVFDTTYSVLDSIIYSSSRLQAAYMAVSPTTGALLAYIGGGNHNLYPYDRTRAKRQPGSTFKPFVYAKALEAGRSLCDKRKNERIIYTQFNDWSPRNSDNNYEGKYSIIGALTNSVNTVSVGLLMEHGIKEQVEFCKRLGIDDTLPHFPSLALGVANLSLQSMVNAYGVFSNGGYPLATHSISRITSANDEVIYEFKSDQQESVLDQMVAADITEALQSVVDNGTGKRLRYKYGINTAIAGKTGTTQNHSDGWFIGYSDSLLAGVWVGADNPGVRFSSIIDGQGANMALPIWALAFNSKYKDLELNSDSLSDGYERGCELYYPEKKDFIHQLFKRKKPKKNSSDGLDGKKHKKRRSIFHKKY